MRVATMTFPNALVAQLNRLASRQSQLQTRLATGQRVQLPEDDASAAQQVLDLQAEAGSVAQHQTNLGSEQDRANAVYSALNSLKTISDRAGEIATLADGTKSQQELTAYATEVTQLIHQAFQVANTQFNGSYLFAGTRSDQPAFALTEDAQGGVASVDYQGNSSCSSTEISPGITVSSQVAGASTSPGAGRGLFTDGASGADLFGHLIALQNHLQTGDTGAIASTDRAGLGADEDNILFQVSRNGAVQARLEAAGAMLSDRATALDTQVSQQADADMAQTLVQFNSTQNAYQAALQSGAKVLNLSLLDYLR